MNVTWKVWGGASLLLSAAGAVAAPGVGTVAGPAPRAEPEYSLYWEGHGSIGETARVDSPREVRRAPLFENAPFLTLKKGDSVVLAKWWSENGKGPRPPGFSDEESPFLLTGGRYERLGYGARDKLYLADVSLSLLFDWRFTLENAKSLAALHLTDSPVTPKQYAALPAALRGAFPGALRARGPLRVRAPFMEGLDRGPMRCVVVEGLAFDNHTNSIYQYQLRIGPEVFLDLRKNLIVGPPPVGPLNFDHPRSDLPNQSAWRVSAEEARKGRAAFRKSEYFRRALKAVIPTLNFSYG